MTSIIGEAIKMFNRAPVPFADSIGPSRRVFPGSQSKRELKSQMEAYGAVGMLFAVVSRIADSTSSLNWRLYRKRIRSSQTGQRNEREEVENHIGTDLINDPNPFYSRKEFFEATQQHIDLTGEGYWVINRDAITNRMPLEIWPIRPDRMEPIPDREEFLAGWVYHGPFGEIIPLELDQVIQIRLPHPLDPYRGLGPVQALLTDIDSERFSAEWNRNFFLNGAEPGGIIEVPERLNNADFNELRDRWRSQHQGVSNAHRVAILEKGKWVERKFSMRDIQFAQLRGLSRDIIREAFGFPKTMLGTTEDINRSNAEAGEVVFSRWIVNTRGDRLKDAMNKRLIPLLGESNRRMEFDFDSPVPLDRDAEASDLTSKAQAAKDLAEAGYDLNSIADVVGLPVQTFSAMEVV